jgi:hypothetical protein
MFGEQVAAGVHDLLLVQKAGQRTPSNGFFDKVRARTRGGSDS